MEQKWFMGIFLSEKKQFLLFRYNTLLPLCKGIIFFSLLVLIKVTFCAKQKVGKITEQNVVNYTRKLTLNQVIRYGTSEINKQQILIHFVQINKSNILIHV